MKKIKVIGITGQTGAGKTTACETIRQMGYPVIDADKIAREVVSEGQQCLADLALEFSIIILNADGTLNRPKLASMVFNNPEKLIRLNQITFPYITHEITERIAALEQEGSHKLVVLDAPTLFESGCSKLCDAVISIIAPETTRLNRIVIRDRLTDDQARARVTAQQPDSYYISRSSFVIVNDKSPEELKERVIKIFTSIGSIL